MPLIILRKMHLIDLSFSTRTPLRFVFEYVDDLIEDGFIKSVNGDLVEISRAGLRACLGKFISSKRRSWLIVDGSDDLLLNFGFIKSRWGFSFSPLCIPIVDFLEDFDFKIFIGWSRILSNIWSRLSGEITPVRYLFNALNLISEASKLLRISAKWSFSASLTKIERAFKLINIAKYTAENLVFPESFLCKFPLDVDCRDDLIDLIFKFKDLINDNLKYFRTIAFKIEWCNLIDKF